MRSLNVPCFLTLKNPVLSRFGRFLLCGLFMAAVGCSRGPEMVPVEGVVLYKEKPLEYGSVMFQPVGVENAKTAKSSIKNDGSFQLMTDETPGVMVGRCQVRITAFAAQRDNAQGNKNQELALGKSAIPQRFQNFGSSGIEIDVRPDMELPLTIDLDAIK